LERSIYNITKKDVLCVAAIGNEAGRSVYPGKLEVVLSAGAVDQNDQLWHSSGRNPDLVLPGVEVYSCVPAGHEEFSGALYAFFSGTSCAAAHLSALAALVMQACPHSGPLEVAEALKKTASGGGK